MGQCERIIADIFEPIKMECEWRKRPKKTFKSKEIGPGGISRKVIGDRLRDSAASSNLNRHDEPFTASEII